MGKWKEKQLNEIASKITDGSHNPPKKVEVGYPMYSGRNLINGKLDFSNPSRYVDELGFEKENKRTNIQAGDIFLSIVGSIGLTAIVPKKFDPFVIQRSIALIRTNQNSEFIRYYFESPTFQNYLIKESRGAAQKGVYLTTLRSTKIPIPPLPEQQRIVAKLDGLFEKLNKVITLLEENILNTQALMGSVLDSEFGRLEASSKTVSISEIADVKGGKRLPKGQKLLQEKTEYPYIRVTDFKDKGTIDLDGLKFISKEVHEQISRYTITSDDLYISIAGTIGKTGIIPSELNGANLTENAAKLVYKDKSTIDNLFVYFYTLSDKFKVYVKNSTKQVAQPKLALTRLKAIKIALPSLEKQKNVVQKFRNAQIQINKLEETQTQKLNHLKALKSSLLDQAFKGEL